MVSTDLAIACSCSWTAPQDTFAKLPSHLAGLPIDSCRRMVRFLFSVPIPFMSSTLMFVFCGVLTDMPIFAEFSEQMSLGMVMTMLFSMIVYPPAVECSEILHKHYMSYNFCIRVNMRMRGLAPIEFGGSPHVFQDFYWVTMKLAKAFRSKIVRVLIFTASFVVIISALALMASPSYTGETPDLFHKGHRLYQHIEVMSLFDDIASSIDVPADTLRNFTVCAPDTLESSCNWYECETDSVKPPQDQCRCYSYISPYIRKNMNELESCGAFGRFFGLDQQHASYMKEHFWHWAEEVVGALISNATRVMSPAGPVLMEDWFSGLLFSYPHYSVSIPGADGIVPSFNSSCMKTMCYCGEYMCFTKVGSNENYEWELLGNQ